MTKEYPLYDKFFHLCPTARFVGGTSRFLCECERPSECKGAQLAAADPPTPARCLECGETLAKYTFPDGVCLRCKADCPPAHTPVLLMPGDQVIEYARTDPPVGTVRGTHFDDCRNVLYIQVDYGTGTLHELPRESLITIPAAPMPWEVLRGIENPDDPEEVLGLEPDDDWL